MGAGDLTRGDYAGEFLKKSNEDNQTLKQKPEEDGLNQRFSRRR